MQILSKRLFLYDPVNRGGSGFLLCDRCIVEVAALDTMQQAGLHVIFQAVLTSDDGKMPSRNIPMNNIHTEYGFSALITYPGNM
jgi:hypothetical protein